MDLSKKLVLLRKERGWTQTQAAQHIDIQQSYLSKLENGHFVPSDDVISKLCDAYNVKQRDLTEPLQREGNGLTIRASILLTISFALILAGQLSLFFSQTYYNYKILPIEPNTKNISVVNFHLTDQYLGENYVQTIEGTKYKFVLEAQREVQRKENGWLTALGILTLLSTVSYLLLKRMRK